LAVSVTCFTEKDGLVLGLQTNKQWSCRSINHFLAKYRHTGTTNRKTAMRVENLTEVEQLCQSQDDEPGTHKSQCQATRIIGLSQRLVQRTLKRHDHSCKTRSWVMFQCFSVATVKKIIFTLPEWLCLCKGEESRCLSEQTIATEIGFWRSWWLSQVCHWIEKHRFFIDTQNTKVQQKNYIDFLKTSLLLFTARQWCRLHARQRSITLRTATKHFLQDSHRLAHKNRHHVHQIWIR